MSGTCEGDSTAKMRSTRTTRLYGGARWDSGSSCEPHVPRLLTSLSLPLFSCRNSITQAAFFFLINEEQSNLTKTIFRLRKIPSSQQRLTFDEYLGCVCAFASLSETELIRFFYEVYSEDSATNSGGSMSESAILKLGRELQAMDSAFSRNVGVATKKMASSRDLLTQQQALLTFQDFERLSRQHRVAFYPLFQMQRNVRAGSLGEPYWVEKTREKLEVEVMVRYMTRNHGRQPLLDWKTKILDTIFWRESLATRVHRRAKELYEAQCRQLTEH